MNIKDLEAQTGKTLQKKDHGYEVINSTAIIPVEGVAAEQARIKSIKAQSNPGHEALVETLMFDGKTTGERAAVKILAAEKTLRESKLKAF